MKLFTKIFLFGMLAFGAAFSASGYFLLRHSLESSVSREADFALKQYQYDKFTVQSALLNYSGVSVSAGYVDGLVPDDAQIYTIWKIFPENWADFDNYYFFEDSSILPQSPHTDIPASSDSSAPENLLDDAAPEEPLSPIEILPALELPKSQLTEGFFRTLASEISVPAAFFAADKTLLYSEIEELDTSFLNGLSENAHAYQFQDTPRGCSVLVGSLLDWNSPFTALTKEERDALPGASASLERIYFVTQWDMSKTMAQQDTLRNYFVRCYLIAMTAGAALLVLLSALLTGPLKRMSRAAGRMAQGYYAERLTLKSGGEIGALAESFNQMADSVEDKIHRLSKAAREKEDFVANFAHELKTPLTSIIGYADTICQRELSREELHKASWRILTEGMRLEALSQKLMELIVLGRQDFPLSETLVTELLQDVEDSLAPLLSEKQITLRLQAQPAEVLMDYDLLKTLLLNLADNSVKAGCSTIELQGTRQEDGYWICAGDDGCGMEEEELSRITEAFYMVDKARSRRQHGAGLGLALADRIAGIHGGALLFKSQKGVGTTVRFRLKYPSPCPQDTDIINADSRDGNKQKCQTDGKTDSHHDHSAT